MSEMTEMIENDPTPSEEAKVKVRAVIDSLLGKYDIMDASELPTPRAIDKLGKIIKQGPPPNGLGSLTNEEKDIYNKYVSDSSEDDVPAPEQEKSVAKKPAAKKKAAPAKKSDSVPIAEAMGKKPGKKGPKTKTGKAEGSTYEMAKKVKAQKPPKASKAPKPVKATKAAKAPKAAKPPKERKSSVRTKSPKGGASIMYAAFAKPGDKVHKAKLIFDLISEGGIGEASAASYVSWAKRPKAGQVNEGKNPFTINDKLIIIEEYVEDRGTLKGQKMLRRKS